MRSELDLLAPQVKNDVCKDAQNEDISLIDMSGSFTQYTTPFEIKITKAKEGKKNIVKFHLFSGLNLKIYDSLSEFFMDMPAHKANSTKLRNHIDLLGMNVTQDLGNTNGDSFQIDVI